MSKPNKRRAEEATLKLVAPSAQANCSLSENLVELGRLLAASQN